MAKPARCARCGRENDPSFAFCLDCGQPLRPPAPAPPAPRTCTGCGATLDAAFRFCGHCGAPVQPAAAAAPAPGPPRPPEPAAAPAPAPARPPDPAAAPAPPSLAAAPIRAERPATAGAVPPRTATGGALRLAVVRPDGAAGASFALDGEEAICGRAEGAIRLADDPTVSPRHARFTVRARSLAVEDLGTVNGTFVRLQGPRALRAGDEVRVGHQLLRLEPVPPPPEDDGAVRPWGAPDTGARFRLVQLLEGGGVGDAFPLRPGENAIGREAGEVTFPSDRYVSSRHARIDVRGAEVTLSDAGSSNGTFVKIAGAVSLAPGDELLVGAQLLRVEGAPQG